MLLGNRSPVFLVWHVCGRLLGFLFAVWIPNRYVALIAPVVLYESMVDRTGWDCMAEIQSGYLGEMM